MSVSIAGFLLASIVLMLIPGPNVALIVSQSLAHGVRAGLATVAGTASAMIPQLLLTSLGVIGVVSALADGLAWLRWLGVAYLIVLGLRQWRAAPDSDAHAPRAGRAWLRGFLVSAVNPKTLLFLAAFFPQFIDPARPVGAQLALLSAIFLASAVAIDSLWAILAARARFWLARSWRLRNRLSGGALIGAGTALALVRR